MAAACGLTTRMWLMNFVTVPGNKILRRDVPNSPVALPESNSSVYLAMDTAADGRGVAAATKRTRIQWTSALDASLVHIERDCGPANVKGRRQRLLDEWRRAHPNLPSTYAALRKRLEIIRTHTIPSGETVTPQTVDPPRGQRAPGAKSTVKRVKSNSNREAVRPVAPVQGETSAAQLSASAERADQTASAEQSDPPRNETPVRTEERGNGQSEFDCRQLDELREEYHLVLGKVKSGVEENLDGRLRPSCQGLRVSKKLLR